MPHNALPTIYYRDRMTGQICQEKVYGGKALRFFYGTHWYCRWIGYPLAKLLAKLPVISALCGWWQRRFWTKKKIGPFVTRFGVDIHEFATPLASFRSFNDFFIRRLTPSARPICPEKDVAIMPADGRFLCYPRINCADGFIVKGKFFTLEKLLADSYLAERYHQGAMLIARLCPSDYHRFHFPCDALAGQARMINGALWSVNPWALQRNIEIFTQNKRMLTTLATSRFGQILYLEVGATAVGSIHQSFQPHSYCTKGAEKGYFSFGGSTLVLLFEPGSIEFSADLVQASSEGVELLCLMGQPLGRAAK